MNEYWEKPFDSPSRPIPAWAFSLVFHMVLLTAIGWSASRPQRGIEGEPDRPTGVAMVERLPDRDVYTAPPSPTDAREETAAASSTAASSAALAPNIAPPIDLDGMLAKMTAGDVPVVSASDLAGEFAAGADSSGQGDRPRLEAKPTTAVVFGISGSGSRFIYVFDRSDSMNGYGSAPLRAAKSELKRSIESLTDAQQFQIIFYNDEAKPFVPAGSGLSLLVGEKSMLRRASSYVDAIKAFGGTEHFDALKMALRMGPDVIFFLTDARVPRLNASQFAEVKRLAERSGASIHTIEFGPEAAAPGDSFLRELAADNRGEYRYIPLEQLTLSEPR
jgi:hypothetical protein